ncbi:MAG TPA: JAB domain-containing protein [Polyangia bacterium]|nr:JAB domain-containing protein [Polyangia bacterium]
MKTKPDSLSSGQDAADLPYRPESNPPRPSSAPRLAGASDVYDQLADIRGADREHLVVLELNVRHRLIDKRVVAIGTLTGLEAHPREIFKHAIINSAAAIIIAHNHPSGDCTPSTADLELTGRLREVGSLVGIPLLDHLVVATAGYVSLAERNWR